jgi:hypothetical protein
VAHRLNDRARPDLPLALDHGGALTDLAEYIAKVKAAADKGDAERRWRGSTPRSRPRSQRR